MIRKIVKIDESKCDGCGLCAKACAESAIAIVDGKAKIVKDQYCDGLGACLGHCPQDAISIEEREAEAFDEEAVKRAQGSPAPAPHAHGGMGCPGMLARSFRRPAQTKTEGPDANSELGQWPVQLALLPLQADYYQGVELLLAADCTAFALGAFHAKLLKGRAVAIACPKLDETEYVEKLSEIIRRNDLRGLLVAHMEVPCCSGLLRIAKQALAASGKSLPFRDVTVGIQGSILSDICE
jgi:Pyruvate/2-oxoacid:ferredoxin oxidoreductase delta subunit